MKKPFASILATALIATPAFASTEGCKMPCCEKNAEGKMKCCEDMAKSKEGQAQGDQTHGSQADGQAGMDHSRMDHGSGKEAAPTSPKG